MSHFEEDFEEKSENPAAVFALMLVLLAGICFGIRTFHKFNRCDHFELNFNKTCMKKLPAYRTYLDITGEKE